MGRHHKPDGCNRSYERVPDSRTFISEVEARGGSIRRCQGSHFEVYVNGKQQTAYDCDEYPVGMQCVLGKFLAKVGVVVGLVLAIAVAVGM